MDKFETWDIKKQGKDYCYYLDFDWCRYHKAKCSFEVCSISVKNSHRYTDTYGRTIEKIKEG